MLYPGVGARLDLTQQQIGCLCGLSRQRVNCALQIMQGASVLRTEYGAVHVLCLAALRQFRV